MSEVIHVRVPDEVAEALRKEAKEADRKLSDYCRIKLQDKTTKKEASNE